MACPPIGSHRGIGIHDCQGPARVKVVKAAIDRVAKISDLMELVDFAADCRQPPEARLFAANKVEVEFEVAAEERRNRPTIDMDRLRATVAGLDSVGWRDPDHYGTLLDPRDAVKRETPLPDEE